MGNALVKVKDVKLKTPFGECGCLASSCGCFGKKVEAEKTKEELAIEEIDRAIKVELHSVEYKARQAMLHCLQTHGYVPTVHVLDQDAMSPPPLSRSLTIRIKSEASSV